MDVPNARQPRNGARSARHERSVFAFPSERRLSPRSDRSLGVSRADRRTGLAACKPIHQHWRSARRGASWAGRLTGRPRYSARRAKGDSEANAEAAGRRERMALLSGYGTVGLSSWHVWSTIGWLPPRPWNGGCYEVGEPARVLFDAAARDDQHKYSGRSLRETGRGSSLAASGGPPPLEIPGRGTRRASF